MAEPFSFAVRFFLLPRVFFFLPRGFFFCREVFSFAVRFFLLPRVFFFCLSLFLSPRVFFLFAARFFLLSRLFLFAVRFFLLSESFSFCRDSCRGNRTYLLLGDHTAEKEPRRGGVQIVRFAQCTPYTIILEFHSYCKWGSVYNVHNRYWNIYLGAVFCGKVVSLYIFVMLITFVFLTEVPSQKSFE